ncbi:MAG: hypothetical protein AABW85_03440 [archaeon]
MLETNTRGQIFSTDLIIAGAVFLLIATMTILYSNQMAQNISATETANAREQAAIAAANSLVYSPGTPGNWENYPEITGVESIGIAKTRNEIDSQKLGRIILLSQTNYTEIKDLLGLSKYGFFVSVQNMQNNQPIYQFGTLPLAEKETSTVNRIATLNGSDIILRVQVYST